MTPHFARVVVVDWSAASRLGPPRPAADRCWLAWGAPGHAAAPEYFRGRHEAERRIAALIAASDGPVLVGFDFPFGYPSGSGLGGGRQLAERLAELIEDDADGSNNRFAVAAHLNAELGRLPGPFWGCSTAAACEFLQPTKPPYNHHPFAERRLADASLAHRRIMPVWQLLGRGAVGGQMLLGLPMVHRLAIHPLFGLRVRIWPFETGWDDDLSGVVLAEMWPSLNDHGAERHRIKDARQVAATRDWLLRTDARGMIGALFARPATLSRAERRRCVREEGWIVGAAAASGVGYLA